jgi:hypothetical protein
VFKRARWTAFGYVAGVSTTYLVARRVKRQLASYAPPEVARRSAARVKLAVSEGRAVMRERERELEREFAVRPRLRSVEER